MDARTLLVVNPAAGGGRAARSLDRVLEALQPWGDFEIAVTRAGEVRPAERIVREAVARGVTARLNKHQRVMVYSIGRAGARAR